ncbi:hypothetical_protein_-_conserved [Leishmania infantum]|nr:hypothetical_protein_-_conserved [Leishmania infantum]SUZ43916.1 hypothetical_protein_-_conserved [Leishmania infantum]
MVRRPAKDARREGDRHDHRPSRTGRKRRHGEDVSSNTPPLSSTSYLESHQTQGRVKSPISRKHDGSHSRSSSSSGQHRYGRYRHREGQERRAGVDDDEKHLYRSADNRHGARQHQRRASDDSVHSDENRRRPCPTSMNDPAPSPQAPMTVPLAASATVLPRANLAVSAPPGATRAGHSKRLPEELAESPHTQPPRMETINERKQLFRTRLYTTPLRVPATEGAEQRGETPGASLTATGATPNDSVAGAPLLRAPPPAILSAAGGPASLSIVKTVPFSEEEHLAWLCAPASPTEIRASAAVPPGAAAASSRGLACTERIPRAQSEGELKHEPDRRTVGATATQQPHLSSGASDVLGNDAPACLQGLAAAPTATAPNTATPLAPQQGEISYKSSFSVLTSWDALMVAPPLLRTTPRMPSLLTQDADSIGTAVVHSSRSTSVTHACVSNDTARIPSTGSRGELLIGTSPATEKGEARQGEEARADAALQQPLFPSSCCTRTPTTVPSRLKCDGHEWSPEDLVHQFEEDSARTFVKHFTNGLVFVDPPWFICPVLLDNCEHPYYMTWMDELEVGSVEEAVAEAKAKLLTDA